MICSYNILFIVLVRKKHLSQETTLLVVTWCGYFSVLWRLFLKPCSLFLSWKTTCLERPHDWVVSWYRYSSVQSFIFLLQGTLEDIVFKGSCAAIQACKHANGLVPLVRITLTQWSQVTYIYFSNVIIIGSDNGLSPGWHQAIIWTNAGTLLTGPLEINFKIKKKKIHTFSFKKHIEAKTKGLPFSRWHFQMHFLEWKYLNFD